MIGQDHACAIAARVIARLKAGLDDPQRPVGALLFAGPTGVGKTELAKQLARYLFGDAERLVRVDMSELVDRRGDRAADHAVAGRHVASPIASAASRCRSCCSTRSRRPTPRRSTSCSA